MRSWSPLAVGAVCGGVLAGMTTPLAGRGHLDQALLTLGCALVLADLVVVACGRDVHGVAAPPGLDGSVSIAGQAYPVYRLALIGVGLALALAIYVIVERTRLGSLVRAAVADRGMLEAMGVDSRKVLFGVFAAGCALAAFAGALGAQIYGARPGLDESILLLALVVVVIGGLGSIKGALVGALVIGQVESLGRALLPDLAPFLLFGAMGAGAAVPAAGAVRVAGGRDMTATESSVPEAPPRLRARRRRADRRGGRRAAARARAVRARSGGAEHARADRLLRAARGQPRPAGRDHRPAVARARRLLRGRRLHRGADRQGRQRAGGRGASRPRSSPPASRRPSRAG